MYMNKIKEYPEEYEKSNNLDWVRHMYLCTPVSDKKKRNDLFNIIADAWMPLVKEINTRT